MHVNVYRRSSFISANKYPSSTVPGEAPIVTEVRSNSFESILLQWEPPQNRLFGILRSFTVRYMNVELPNPQFVYHRNISNTARSFVIAGLIQFTNYSVELAAVTIGDGEFSDPKIVRTDQDSESVCTPYCIASHHAAIDYTLESRVIMQYTIYNF